MSVSSYCVLAWFCLSAAFGQEPLTNDSIVKLVKGGLAESVIVSMINSQPGKYNLSADAVLDLTKAGVSTTILTTMIAKSQRVGRVAARGHQLENRGRHQKRCQRGRRQEGHQRPSERAS